MDFRRGTNGTHIGTLDTETQGCPVAAVHERDQAVQMADGSLADRIGKQRGVDVHCITQKAQIFHPVETKKNSQG